MKSDTTWHVLADPVWKDKHPLHEARFVATSTDVEVNQNIDGESGWNFVNRDDSIVCTMPDSPTQKEDARLIAAAPTMLEALKAVRDLLKHGSAFLPDIQRICDSAIIRADGTKQR